MRRHWRARYGDMGFNGTTRRAYMALGQKCKFGDRQASSDHGQCVGNNSADQNSSAPRLLALTLKQSPEVGRGEARLFGGQHEARGALPCRPKRQLARQVRPCGSHREEEEGCRPVTAFDCHRYACVRANCPSTDGSSDLL